MTFALLKTLAWLALPSTWVLLALAVGVVLLWRSRVRAPTIGAEPIEPRRRGRMAENERIVFVERGRVVDEGPPGEVLARYREGLEEVLAGEG